MAVVENDKLFIRSFYLPFEKSSFARIAIDLAWLLIFPLLFPGDEPKNYGGILAWGMLVLFRLPRIYDTFFKRSYATRIPLQQLLSFTTEDDQHGYQTVVKLHLKNGRYRKLVFRKLENEVQPFTDLLSEYLAFPKFA
jgi:hypothetical protein